MALALGVAGVAFAVLNRTSPAVPLYDDAVRDQLLARDCAELGQCHSVGASASLLGLYHGSLWIDLLALIKLTDGTPATDRIAVLALAAVSIATTFILVWRWIRPSTALPAAVLFGSVLIAERYLSDLINPSVSALPDVLTAAGLAAYALSGQRRFLLIAAVALGVAIDVHVAALALVPALVVIALIGRPAPWRLVAAMLGVGTATYGLVSSATLRANLIGLLNPRGLLFAAITLGGAAGLARLGPRFRAAPRDVRAWIVGVILVGPVVIVSMWLFVWRQEHFNGWYLHPIFAPAAVLAAGVFCAPFEIARRWVRAARWMPTAVAAVTVAFVVRHSDATLEYRGAGDPWSVDEAASISDALTQRGWSYESSVFRLQADACRELLRFMSLVAPPPGTTDDHAGRQIQVLKMPSEVAEHIADRRDLVALRPGTTAVVREVASWLRPESLRACRVPLDSTQSPSCAPARVRDPSTYAPGRFLFQSRVFPEIHALDVARPYTARYEIPLVPTASEDRDFALADPPRGDCDWRITAVTGVEADGALPARRVRVHSRDGAPAMMVVERTFGAAELCDNDADTRSPPCLLEAHPGDRLLKTIVP